MVESLPDLKAGAGNEVMGPNCLVIALVPVPFYTEFSSTAKPPLRSPAWLFSASTQGPQGWYFHPARPAGSDGSRHPDGEPGWNQVQI
jgi:hypothetical protein